jgi:hypothetical protein
MREIKQKWFASATPINANYASVDIGEGDNGVVTITADTLGTEENSYSIELVEGVGADVDLSATITDGAIVVTLGTDELEALDDTKNTATLVAGVIDALSGVSAEASGTGATAFTAAVAETSLSGGTYAVESHEPAYMIDGTTIYICTEPVDKYSTDGWKTGTLSAV